MPDDLRALVSDEATSAGLDPEFVSRLVTAESNWNPSAVSKKGATGLMQLMPETGKQYGATDLTDPKENIKAGIAFLKDLHKKYGGRHDLMAAAYNAGPGAVDKAGGKVPNIAETRAYVDKVDPFAKFAAGSAPEDPFAAYAVKSEPSEKTTPPKSGPPSTYAQDVGKYATGEVKGFVRGVTDLVNPQTYIDTAKGVAAGVRDLPAYVRGFSMDDLRRAPGQLRDAAGEFISDPEAVGRVLGNVVAGKAGITPSRVARTTAAAGRATAAGARAIAPTVVPALAKYGTEAAGAAVGGAAAGPVGAAAGVYATRDLANQAAATARKWFPPKYEFPAGPPRLAGKAPTVTEALDTALQDVRATGQAPAPARAVPGAAPGGSEAADRTMRTLREREAGRATAQPATTSTTGPEPGMVRLYRGESTASTAGPLAGQTFTDNPLDALYYAKQGGSSGKLMHIDVPAEDAARYKIVDRTGQGVHILPRDLAEQARSNVMGAPKGEVGTTITRTPPGVSGSGVSKQQSRPGVTKAAPSGSPMSQAWAASERLGIKPSASEMSNAASRIRAGEDPEAVIKSYSSVIKPLSDRDQAIAEALITKYSGVK